MLDFGKNQLFFFAVLGLLALQRLLELRYSRANEAWMRRRGGREHAARQYRMMVLLHLSWFVAMLVEVVFSQRPFSRALFVVGVVGLLAGQLLRYLAIFTLGRRWSVRVYTLPGRPPVLRGVYRYVRHPNYLGVIFEIASVPLLHGAWLTAGIYTVLNLILIVRRVRAEENALERDNNYARAFEPVGRFLPLSRANG